MSLDAAGRSACATSHLGLVVVLAFAFVGCRKGPPRAPAIGEAYVGPGTLKIRKDLPVESAPVATLRHGDRVEILSRRRKLMRVRTAAGTEGWTEERSLLAAEDMTNLRDLGERAARMPSQGQAICYAEANVRAQPSTAAPSFFQIREKEKVDVLMNVVTPHIEVPRTPLLPPVPKKAKSTAKKPAAKPPKYPPPPMPKPPGLPPNWEELSKSPKLEDDETPPEAEPEKKPAPQEQWSLVRNREGQSGWIPSRRLVMAIPDEVAQYAEGKHIVSYFLLAKVQDGDVTKATWLWTTSVSRTAPYDFDSFRVFTWSLRRHRYETAHIERNLYGYLPVVIKDVEYSGSAKSRDDSAAGKYPGFSICVENDDGKRVRREFVLLSNVVRYAGEQPCEAPVPFDVTKPAASLKIAPEPVEPEVKPSFTERVKNRFRGWFGRNKSK